MAAGISFSGKQLRAELRMDGRAIELNSFTEQVVARTVVGAISCLKGAETIDNLELSLKQGDVSVVVNSNELQLAPFPKDIIANIVTGMVSSLKGAESKPQRLVIKVRVD